MSRPTQTLYRPIGPTELALIEAAAYRAFSRKGNQPLTSPRLPEQPIFYPVMNEAYAREIASAWNVREVGGGFVTRFEVDAEFVARYPVQTVVHRELWVPAEELELFNSHIVGRIDVIATYR